MARDYNRVLGGWGGSVISRLSQVSASFTATTPPPYTHHALGGTFTPSTDQPPPHLFISITTAGMLIRNRCNNDRRADSVLGCGGRHQAQRPDGCVAY